MIHFSFSPSPPTPTTLGHPGTAELWRGHRRRWRVCLCAGEEGLCEGRALDPRSCCGTPRSRLVHSSILSSHKRPLCWPMSRSTPSNRCLHATASKYLLLPAGQCAVYKYRFTCWVNTNGPSLFLSPVSTSCSLLPALDESRTWLTSFSSAPYLPPPTL